MCLVTPENAANRTWLQTLTWSATGVVTDVDRAVFTANLPTSSGLYRWVADEVGVGGLLLSRVEMVKPTEMLLAFLGRLKMTKERRSNPSDVLAREYRPEDAVKRGMLQKLRNSLEHTDSEHVDVLLGWHGCSPAKADRFIAGEGDLMSEGSFGQGMYFSRQPQYAAGQATECLARGWAEPNERGEHVLLLCALSVGRAYPISRRQDYQSGSNVCSFHGRRLKPGFDTHYMLSRREDNFQATSDGVTFHFEEAVVDEDQQVLPFAKVYVRADREQLQDYLFRSAPTKTVPGHQ